MDSDVVGWGMDGMRSQSKGPARPSECKEVLPKCIVFSVHYPGVCCLRASPDKPNHDGFATHKAVSTKIPLCASAVVWSAISYPSLSWRGKAQGGRLEEIIFPCVVQKLAPDAVYRQLIWKSERFMWFASLLLHHPWALDWLTMCGELSDCFRAHSQTSRRESFGHIFAVCFWVEVTNLKPILN